MGEWMAPHEWLESLDADSRAKADRLIALLEERDASDPVSWVSSEMQEGIPQVARFLFLDEVRRILVDPLQTAQANGGSVSPRLIEERGRDAYDRLVAVGVDRDDLERIAQGAACTATEEFLGFLDGVYGSESDDDEDEPRWALMEVTGASDNLQLTGRCLDGLHESFSDLYSTDS